MKKLNVNEVVKVEQLPKIFQQLEKVGKYIDDELAKVKDLKATEENKQEVKKVRTGINNTLKQFENKRKEIKQECLKAYEEFNTKYEEEVKSKLDNASEQLKKQIDLIELEQIRQKQIELDMFIREHIQSNHLENILDVSHLYNQEIGGLKVNLSTSLKSLKEQALAFIDKVDKDIKLINMGGEEYVEELMYEYQNNGFDFVKAKTNIVERHKMIEQYTKQQEQVQEVVKQEEKQEQVVQEILQPKEIIEEDEILECSFTIKTTKENLIKIKNYLKELGIEYE